MTSKDLVNYNVKNTENKVWAHCASPDFCDTIGDLIEFADEDSDYKAEIEICVTKDTEAGLYNGMGFKGFGVFVKGEVTAMFNRDIASRVDKGVRSFIDSKSVYLVEDYNKLQPSFGNVTESFLIPTEIVGVWYTSDFKPDWRYIEKMCPHLKGLPVVKLW